MISKTIIVAWTLFSIYGAATGYSNVDQDMLQTSAAYQAGVWVGMAGWAVAWFIVVVPVALIGIVFRRPEKPAGETSFSWAKFFGVN